MNQLACRMGFWSAVTITVLVILIDVGMILSTLFFPITSVTNMDSYAASFSSFQMLPFIPSLILAPVFVILMFSIHHTVSEDKKFLTQLALGFSLICAAILSLHYYIQLTVVQQGLLNHETTGLWQFVTPNPHSFFWTFAALGYGFMGISLLCAFPAFAEKSGRAIKWLFIANGIIGVGFLIGNVLGVFMVNILSSFLWGVLFPIAAILLAKKFRVMQRFEAV
jgi:hypothetical protein